MNEEMLFDALADVGDDLLVMAEHKRFVSPWRKWGQTAAVLAVVACLSALALPYFPMGCGASQESAAYMEDKGQELEECEETVTEECVEECAEESPEMQTTVVTEGVPESTEEETVTDSSGSQVMDGEAFRVRNYDKIICRETYFYLEPVSEDMGVPPLGEELGVITGAEDLSLVGCRVFTVPHATWFTNFAINGEAVTQNIYVQTPSGYRYGSTWNEKTRSRYTVEDVQAAIEKEELQWLADTFVQPIESYGGVAFTLAKELSLEELDTMFLASTMMNTGMTMLSQWSGGYGGAVVPAADVRWRLERFLDLYDTIDFTQSEYYNAACSALVYPEERTEYTAETVRVHGAQMMDENRLWILISLPDRKGVTKEYIIRFDEDSWRYESIHEIGPG